MGQVIVNGVVTGSIYGLFAVGIVLVFRGSRVVNFAAPEIATFAVYIAWTAHVRHDIPWIAAAIVAVLAAGLISLIFERVIVARMTDAPRLAVAVGTIGLMLMLLSLEILLFEGQQNLPPPIRGLGPKLFGVFVSPTKMLALGTVVVLGVGLTTFLNRTDFGLGVQAAAQDATAVRLVGVPLAEVSGFVWAVGGMLAAIAGLLVVPSIGAFAPGSLTNDFFVPALAAALVGGLDNVNGAFIGGLLVGVVNEWVGLIFVTSTFPGASTLVVFGLILVILLVAPGGVPARIRERLKRNLDLSGPVATGSVR